MILMSSVTKFEIGDIPFIAIEIGGIPEKDQSNIETNHNDMLVQQI